MNAWIKIKTFFEEMAKTPLLLTNNPMLDYHRELTLEFVQSSHKYNSNNINNKEVIS